jgi:hemerythrin superfamily protein
MTKLLAKIAPNATDMIRADHARVLTTFHRYSADAAPATKRSLVATICLALEVHAELEEEIFYPAMGSVDAALVGRLIPEHDRMRTLIGQLRNGDPADPGYDAQLMELMREVMHHVADEETILLPQAERVLGERLGELGARMMKRRVGLMAPHAGELTRHKARSMPMTNWMIAAGGVIAGVVLLRHVMRHV